MTCTARAKRNRKLWNALFDDEKTFNNDLQLHELLHEIVNERYGEMSHDSADTVLARMSDEDYELLWFEALTRFRKRKRASPILQELQVYG